MNVFEAYNSKQAKKANERLNSSSMFKAKLLGDSVTFQNMVSTHYSDRGYFVWANMLLGQAFELIGNFGMSGQRSDEILARTYRDIIQTNKPTDCFVLVGINDISQMLEKGLTAAKTFDNIRKIYELLTNANIRVIALTIPASNSWKDPAQLTMYFELNRLIKAYARNRPGVILADCGSVYLDGATLGPATKMAVDGTHPSAAGAVRMGELIAEELRKHIVIQPTTLTYSNIDPGNLLTNPILMGTAGTKANTSITGDIADGWIGAAYSGATAVASKVNRSLRQGTKQRITVSGGGETGNAFLYRDFSAGFAVGDTLYAQIAVKIGAGSKVTKSIEFGIDCRKVVSGAGTNTGQYYGLFHESAFPDIEYTPSGELLIRTPNFIVPPETTQLRYGIRIYMSDGYFDVDVGEVRRYQA